MAHLKRSIVEVQAEENCLPHALIIAISRLEKDANYNSYRRGCRIRPVVQNLCKTTAIDLSNGAWIPELVRFQEQFRQNKIVAYHGLSCEDIMFEDQVDSPKRINLLYADVERHCHVIANLTAATTRRYVCKGCNNSCTCDVTHVYDQMFSDYIASPPCAFSHVRITCTVRNRHFGSRTCYAKHKQRPMNKNLCANRSDVAQLADGS